MNESAVTVRASQSVLLSESVPGWRKFCAADLAEKLTAFAVVAIEVYMWGSAFRADTVFGDVTGLTLMAFDRLDDLAVALAVVIDETFPGPAVMMVLELREYVGLEFLVLRRPGVIESELFQRDILSDERHQPSKLFVEVIDFIEK